MDLGSPKICTESVLAPRDKNISCCRGACLNSEVKLDQVSPYQNSTSTPGLGEREAACAEGLPGAETSRFQPRQMSKSR